MARIADDGYLPKIVSIRKQNIPRYAIITMAMIASLLTAIGGLRLILEFGSITFLLVSLLMSIANFKIRAKTKSSLSISIISIIGLTIGTALILYYEFISNPEQLLFIGVLYAVLTLGACGYAHLKNRRSILN